MEILDLMESVIPEPRKEVSKYAPKMEVFYINPDKIKEVIGKGGDTITKIILDASNVKTVQDKDAVKVDLADDGQVIIYHTDKDVIERTAKMIKDIVREVEPGVKYPAKVVKVEEFGCFVHYGQDVKDWFTSHNWHMNVSNIHLTSSKLAMK